jgi:hypothetical protein
MKQHCLWMLIPLPANLGFLIDDGDMVNAYMHADVKGPTILMIVDDVFQSWYKDRTSIELSLVSCTPSSRICSVILNQEI